MTGRQHTRRLLGRAVSWQRSRPLGVKNIAVVYDEKMRMWIKGPLADVAMYEAWPDLTNRARELRKVKGVSANRLIQDLCAENVE